MSEPSPRALPPEDQARVAEKLRLGAEIADLGRYEEAGRLFREALAAARGSGTQVERSALSYLSRLFVRERREIEALSISRRLLTLAEKSSDHENRCLALAGMSGALGHLEDWRRFDERAAELDDALDWYRGEHLVGIRRHLCRFRAIRSIAEGDLVTARRQIDVLRSYDDEPEYPPSRRFGHLVHALVDIAHGRAEDARASLARADAVKEAQGVHAPLRAYVSARATIAIDGPEMGQAAVKLALFTTEGAADGVAARLRYALLLAAVAENELRSPELARRGYESAAAAVLLRTAEIDRAMREIPELAGEHDDDAKTLFEFRRRFKEEQERVFAAVTPLLLASMAAGELPLWTRDSLRDAIGVCAWCLRVRLLDGTMLPVGHFLPSDPALRVSHGICPPCMIRLSAAGRAPAPRPKP